MGQYFPDLHLLQLSDGGLSTIFCSLPYFLLGICEPSIDGTYALSQTHNFES